MGGRGVLSIYVGRVDMTDSSVRTSTDDRGVNGRLDRVCLRVAYSVREYIQYAHLGLSRSTRRPHTHIGPYRIFRVGWQLDLMLG
jgi:hypothetical protein